MASIISAGTTSGTALNMAGDTSGVLQLATNGSTTALTIDASQRAAFVAGTAALPAITTTGDTNTGLWFPAADTIAASTNGTERWSIDSGGILASRSSYASGTIPLALGSSGGGYPDDRGIVVYNTAAAAIPFIAYTSTTTQAGYILTSGSTIAFVQGSDYRLKENVVPMDKAETLSKLMQVKPVNFDWKDGNKLHNYGFIAHELQEVFPQAIHGEKDAVREDGNINPQSVNLAALVPYLVAAIQEQQTIINDLTARITALEGAA